MQKLELSFQAPVYSRLREEARNKIAAHSREIIGFQHGPHRREVTCPFVKQSQSGEFLLKGAEFGVRDRAYLVKNQRPGIAVRLGFIPEELHQYVQFFGPFG